MFKILIFLLSIVILHLNASIPLSTIESDAMELTSLQKIYLNVPSYGLYRQTIKKSQCRLTSQCCPNERAHLFTLTNQNLLEEKCFNKQSHTPSCTNLIKEYGELKNDPKFGGVSIVLDRNSRRQSQVSKRKDQMQMICSMDELESYICQPDDLSKYQSCQMKVLENLLKKNNETYYNTTIQQWKIDVTVENENLWQTFSDHSSYLHFVLNKL